MTLAIDRNNNTLYLCASDLSSMYGALGERVKIVVSLVMECAVNGCAVNSASGSVLTTIVILAPQ